jgi:hypothetical protein
MVRGPSRLGARAKAIQALQSLGGDSPMLLM